MTEELKQKTEKLAELQKKMFAFKYATSAMYLDGVTVAPRDTEEGRGEALGILSEYEYSLATSKETIDLLEYLKAHNSELSEHQNREVELLMRDYEFTKNIPADEYVAYQKAVSKAGYVWHRAKEENDFESFKPCLKELFDYRIRFAKYYKPDKNPYDVQLNMYERGLDMKKCDEFFKTLRNHIVPLIRKIEEKPQIDDSPLFGNFPIEKQKLVTEYVMNYMGIDPNHCNCGETEHPFTLEFTKDDVRITTHYYEDNAVSSMYSVIHESGHALYELGGADEHKYTVVAGGASMAIHESQSRFFENIIGRSEAFTAAILPKLQELFPEQLGGISPRLFYEMINKAEPSLIRTEADELTYALHVMVRYEIEKKMFAGELTVDEIPAEWNRLYKEYLGVDVPDDTHGCLQDSHWSGGDMGYFPSYALGSAYGAQMLAKMKEDIDVDAVAASGTLKPISDWLGERIYQYASMYDPDVIFEKACGAPFDPTYYTDYLEKKYSDIYKL